jgi:gliding motility-associated-like protein
MKSLYLIVVVALHTLIARSVYATHIYGGDMSLTAIGQTPNLYRLKITLFVIENSTPDGASRGDANVFVYRKRGNVLVEKIALPQRENEPMSYSNPYCAKSGTFALKAFYFYKNHLFDPGRYANLEDYYFFISWGARSYQITNVADSRNLALVLYSELPSFKQNNGLLRNSSPGFVKPTSDYACVGKPFTADFKAVDPDGDELRYSFATPAKNYGIINRNGASPLEPVAWATGVSLQNLIPGKPTLAINPQTGLISVTPTATGLYVFSVQCEEYRNGQRIGLVRRDFTLTVIDCKRSPVPIPVVTNEGQPVRSLQFCDGQSDTLRTDPGSGYRYQWQRNRLNLPGEVKPYLVVNQSGDYSVTKSRVSECASDTTSGIVSVRVTAHPPADITTSAAPVQCEGSTLVLQVPEVPSVQYAWWKDGRRLPGASDNKVMVRESGRYTVFATATGSACVGSDTLLVRFNPRPKATLKADKNAYCEGETASLRVVDNIAGLRYQWLWQGQPRSDRTTSVINVQAGGAYQVNVTNQWGCTALSNLATIVFHPLPAVRFDSLSPICDLLSAPISLSAEPSNGTFSGASVDANQFYPDRVGAGTYPITYTVTNAEGCTAQQTRLLTVSPRIELALDSVIRINRRESVTMPLTSNIADLAYSWSPPEGLSNSEVISPIATPDSTTRYVVVARDAAGCQAVASVRVDVIIRLMIPSAFSPDGDGINDVWELRNADAFPNLDLTIVNRWGEVMFQTKGYKTPWDGKTDSVRVAPGVYQYLIRLGNGQVLRGDVTVLR